MRWQRAALSREEPRLVCYIDEHDWIALSAGSRLATHAAVRINAGIEVCGVSDQAFAGLSPEFVDWPLY